MAAISLEDIIKTIRFQGDYQNVRKFPNDMLTKIAQRAFDKYWQYVAKTHNGWWDTDGTIVTVANQRYAALLPDVWSLRAVDRLDGSDYVEMTKVALSERNRYGATTGKPLSYRPSARGIEMFPTPDTVYTLRLTYTPKAPKLATSQPRDYYNGWEEYIIESVLLVLDGREKLPTDARERAIAAALEIVRDGAGEHAAQEPEYLRLHDTEALDPFRDGIM